MPKHATRPFDMIAPIISFFVYDYLFKLGNTEIINSKFGPLYFYSLKFHFMLDTVGRCDLAVTPRGRRGGCYPATTFVRVP